MHIESDLRMLTDGLERASSLRPWYSANMHLGASAPGGARIHEHRRVSTDLLEAFHVLSAPSLGKLIGWWVNQCPWLDVLSG